MKTTNLSPKVLIGDPQSKIRNPKLIAARRKQFMREYRRLYKETKRFVIEVLRQNSPQRRKGRKEKFRPDNRLDWIKKGKECEVYG